MLTVLKIQHLALVDDLTWELGPGLVGVTGETGAGKSIIVGALKLVLGERADRSLVRNGEEACTVEAVFNLPKVDEINNVLENAGLESCEDNELVIKRVIGAEKGNRQFVNCSPVTITVLRQLGQYLVDLHGPHDHQSLLSQDRQLAMLNAYASAEKALERYQKRYREWRSILQELNETRNSARASEQELDLLRYQVEEIDAADPQADEGPALEQRYKMASNSHRLAELAGQILLQLGGQDSVLSRLSDIQRLIRELEKTDPGAADITREIHSAQVELEELESGLHDYAANLEFNSAEVAELEERFNTLEMLKRKYGSTIEEVLEFRKDAASRLQKTEGREEEIERLEIELKEARKKLDDTGMDLSQKRRASAPKLAKAISKHLSDLGFKRAKIDIELIQNEEPATSGMEQVDFSFAPNPGEPPKPLRIIASSGEMARVMLAVKSALANQDAIPLLVFDEIDANVGGEIALAVGAKMADLAKNHQVISITHLPQVAALAHYHYLVQKEFADDRTRSVLTEVAQHSRVTELARMLGGSPTSARAHAESLLSEKKVVKKKRKVAAKTE